jgi:DNA-binding LytR/AlgR family response regulator
METYRILIVEDDQLIAESLRDIIYAINHEVVDIASNANDAIQIIESEKPDLALLDIQINGKTDGVELADMIRELTDMPFIFTTAFADSATLERAKEMGPYGYVVKPYGIKDVNAAIEIAMSNYKTVKNLKRTNEEGLLQNNNLYVRTDSRLVKIQDDDILYIEAKGDYAIFKTEKKSYIVHSTMKNIAAKLRLLFCRRSSSFVLLRFLTVL